MKKLILSIIVIFSIVYVYSQNLVYEELVQEYENNNWENLSKKCNEYDEQSNIIQIDRYHWSSWDNSWELYTTVYFTNTYDDYGNLIQQYWEQEAIWYFESNLATYDSTGKLIQNFYHYDDFDQYGGWREVTNDYNYDELDFLVLETQFTEGYGDQIGYHSDSLYVDYFYINNLPVEKMYYELQNSSWIVIENEVIGYDDLGNITSRLITKFIDNEWINWERYSFAYDFHNNLTEYIKESWFTYQNIWHINRHYIANYIYDDNENISTMIREEFASDGSTQGLYSHTYDYTVNIEENAINNFQTNYFLSNSPNPFNPSTTIEFSLQNSSEIYLSIYNNKGQKIKTLAQNKFTKGDHSIIWNGDNEFEKSVSSGVYLYKLNVNGKTEAVKKCLLLK